MQDGGRFAPGIEVNDDLLPRVVDRDAFGFVGARLNGRSLAFRAHPALAITVDFAPRLAMNMATVVQRAVVLGYDVG